MAENNTPKDLNQQINEHKYVSKEQMPEISEEVKKEMDKQKKELDKVKNWLVKKYNFTLAIGILPPQSIPEIEKEEDIPEDEKKDKRIHIVHIIPEEQFKNIPKIKKEVLEFTKHIKPKLWFHFITPVDIWNFLMDARYQLSTAVAMSFPIYDKGLLGALRVAEVHKNLVLRKFEKYVSSYVIAGSLVRGTATKISDVDVFVIIDDTDVKRMPRLELKEKLRGIIYQYIPEAQAIAGAKNRLEPQIYLLTEFWEAVKDAHPVMFTFIRDGIPLYDRGTFVPWKLLLKMGKIKPSPESIDMFMSMGDKTSQSVNRRLIDAMIDIYWAILTPSQALLMLYGLPPPVPKDTAKIFKETFVDKEKLIEKKYVDILDKVVQIYKDYEHGKLNEIPGDEIDKLLKDSNEYIKRMKKLREQIEKTSQGRTIEGLDKDIFELLKNLFGKKPKKELITLFEKELVKKGKMPPKTTKVLNDLEKLMQDFKKGKAKVYEIENVRKDAAILINQLIDYGQRCDLVALEKSRMQIAYKGKRAELILTDSGSFLIEGMSIKKITNKLENSDAKELENAIKSQKDKMQTKIPAKIFDVLKKELGDFEVVL